MFRWKKSIVCFPLKEEKKRFREIKATWQLKKQKEKWQNDWLIIESSENVNFTHNFD